MESKLHFSSLVAILWDSNRFYQAGVKLVPARVTTSSQSSCGIGLTDADAVMILGLRLPHKKCVLA